MSVFVAVKDTSDRYEVFPAKGHQSDAFLSFKKAKELCDQVVEIKFEFPLDIVFNLTKFDSPDPVYHEFCYLNNEKGEKHILSDNKPLLQGYADFMNRLGMGGGYKKSTKRKPVTKRKPRRRKSRSRKSRRK